MRLNHLPDSVLRERTDISQDLEQDGRLITLYTNEGTRIAGADLSLPADQKVAQPFQLKATITEDDPSLYCFAAPREPNRVLLVCRSSREISDIEQVFKKALSLGIAAIFFIGVIASVVLGLLSLRQIQSITASVETIMKGDLSGRLSLSHLFGDLRHLAEVVNEMLSRLERLMLEVKNSSENIAHDLRTPLTRVLAKLERSIRSVSDLEQMKELNSEAASDIKQIVYRFSALLRISELEDRLRRSEFKSVDVLGIVRDAVEFYEPLAHEKDVRIVLYDTTASSMIEADRSLIFEAISNLMDNALKYSRENESIEVSVTESPLALEIRDFGPGIHPDDVEILKERYKKKGYRYQSAGFGIGLSIVDSIARLHNFRLEFENANPGCRVKLIFST
ncbi:HAMP domain-containing sensor histidine kinase [Methylobacterium sp. NEAU K]|uniref:sensor histidine kinase n=1 Tax=Methylobacterium sp. NEAU K TaxID=3064946 RepID=UPI0027358D49|nr:ATP-binding protein [Methylobacterium sp. NEAU K]MDP4003127.1 ATP-binding protein [Methylobacterium sp. NEAU K]